MGLEKAWCWEQEADSSPLLAHYGMFTMTVPVVSWLILGLRPANERRRNFVTTSLIGWAQACNQPCSMCEEHMV